ncbi:MAG: class IIb bacteriocin, lactobin A/cerein 7B family [Prolixibacteraceae bacterium]
MENLTELTEKELKTVEGGSILIIIAALVGIGLGIWAGLSRDEEK